MAKKKKAKAITAAKPVEPGAADATISRQTAGGVTGAVIGGIVAGPLGALAGGVTGAVVGDASAHGRKPIKRAVEMLRTEIGEVRVKEAVKSMAQRVRTRITALRKGHKKDA